MMNKIKLSLALIPILAILSLIPKLYADESGSREQVMSATLNKFKENKTTPPPVQSGAWGFKKGSLYTEIYSKYYWHKYQFDAKGHKKRWAYGGRYSEIRKELKLEYGPTDRYTLMLYAPYKEAHWKDDFQKRRQDGFVEIWPGVKYLLFIEPFNFAIQARVKLPFHYDEHAVPALGRHQIDAEFKILTAQTWARLPGYTKLEFGFRGRNEEPADEIPYFFELGYNLNPRIILKTTVDGQKALTRRGQIAEDWTKGTFGPIIKLTGTFNLEFGYGNTFTGKNTSAAQEAYLSLYSVW